MRLGRLTLALATPLLLAGCAAKYSQVAPRLDLAPYGRVALVTFSGPSGPEGLDELATQRFAEAVLQSQSGIEVLELQPRDSALLELAARGDGPAFAEALGRTKDIPAVFIGQMKVSGTRAKGSLTSPTSLRVRAEVSAELSVQLLSTRTGGTLWRSSAAATGTVGQLTLSGGLPSVAARATEEAYGEVVQELVAGVTRDLRPTWVRQ